MTTEMMGITVLSAKRSKPKSHFDDCENSPHSRCVYTVTCRAVHFPAAWKASRVGRLLTWQSDIVIYRVYLPGQNNHVANKKAQTFP